MTQPSVRDGHPPQPATPMVGLQGVRKVYGRSAAVDDVSLDIAAGEFVTLLGPSGSGKTTCLRIIAGMIRPEQGTVTIAGRDVSTVPMHKRNIGMVFQNYSLFPHLSVSQNVAYPLRVRKVKGAQAQRAVEDALAMVRLDGFGDRRPDQLSGGQQQRVALARALVFQPDVLLLDEPLSALDRVLREEMQLELRRIHRDTGATMICVTHDRTEALTMSDRVVVLRGGRVIQDDRPREIYERSNSRFVAEFLGETNVLSLTLKPGPRGGRLVDDHGRALGVPRGAGSLPEGPVELISRVETVGIAPAGGARDGWTGTVVESVFLGDAMRYVVDCAPHTITARVPIQAVDVSIGIGSVVGVVIDPDRSMVFPRP